MVLKPSLYVQHVNGTVHKLMKIWTFTDMCTEFKQSNRQFFFVCVFLSLSSSLQHFVARIATL